MCNTLYVYMHVYIYILYIYYYIYTIIKVGPREENQKLESPFKLRSFPY